MKETMFYKILKDAVKCEMCARDCIITEGQKGFCSTRQNIKGKLYSLNYGKICSSAIDPVEKKPLYHFAPGSHTFSISSVGCNFNCRYCCNYSISQEWKEIAGEEFTPSSIIDIAKDNKCQGISFTYVEPTVFWEFAYDTAKITRKEGLFTNAVTNGFTTPKAIKRISKYLDAVTVDFKGSGNPSFYKKFSSVPNVEPIYDALLAYKKNKVYTEITNLLVPKVGDDMQDLRKLCKWIVENLGEMTPFHILQFFPTYKMDKLERTPVETMEKAYDIAKKEGLKYVYLGNVHSHRLENTYCHNCGTLLIERSILGVKKMMMGKDLSCPNCKESIPIRGEKWVPGDLWQKSI